MTHLRAIEPEDLDLLYAIENDSTIWDVSATNVPYSRYVLHDYIAHATGDIYTDRQVRLVIEIDDHQPIGLLDIFNFDPSNNRAELGIVIQKPFRHHGYALDVLEKVARYATQTLHLHQLYAYVSIHNEAAFTLFKKAGWNTSATLAHWLFDGKEYCNAYLMQTFFEKTEGKVL